MKDGVEIMIICYTDASIISPISNNKNIQNSFSENWEGHWNDCLIGWLSKRYIHIISTEKTATQVGIHGLPFALTKKNWFRNITTITPFELTMTKMTQKPPRRRKMSSNFG